MNQLHTPTGQCPPAPTNYELLAEEVEAYCASLPFRIARGQSEEEARGDYVGKLMEGFYGRISGPNVLRAWIIGCPQLP